ncbi:transposase [Candidatus Vondammii sp. HM_W22]|nr:transposase [Candidatus Vondammii sp. HM_W22]
MALPNHEQSEASNSRNGTTSKTLQTEDDQFELDTPRGRAGSRTSAS